MNRRDFTALMGTTVLAGLWAGSAQPVSAAALTLDDINTYLRGLTTARGRFQQINPDGTKSQGTFYLHRPGRMRFEYDAPDPALVVAGGSTLAIFDKKSNQPPHRYPLKQTPLNVFLERNLDLKDNAFIKDLSATSTSTVVTAEDPEHPEYGQIKLVFTPNPTELRQWILTDQTGQDTRIILGELTKGETLSSFLFNHHAIEEELKRR